MKYLKLYEQFLIKESEDLIINYQELLKKRYHSSRDPITGKVIGNKIYPNSLSKKEHGENMMNIGKPTGFWYGFNNSWIKYIETEFGEEYGLKAHPHHYEVHLKKDAQIIVLDSEESVNKFRQLFGDGKGLIDWNKCSQSEWDGIEMPDYEHLEMRFWGQDNRYHQWLYSWDVSSGCIWNPEAIDYLIDVSPDLETIKTKFNLDINSQAAKFIGDFTIRFLETKDEWKTNVIKGAVEKGQFTSEDGEEILARDKKEREKIATLITINKIVSNSGNFLPARDLINKSNNSEFITELVGGSRGVRLDEFWKALQTEMDKSNLWKAIQMKVKPE